MDDVCVSGASVMNKDNRTFDNFRVNEVTPGGETLDDVDLWGGE